MKYKPFYPFLLLFALVACETLGMLPAKTFEDRAGLAIGTHTAVLNSVTYALDQGQMSSAEAEGIVNIADNARELIDTAREIRSVGNAAEAEKTLAMVNSILRRLQEHVREQS